MKEERRLAAIMFTDMVGYTALMGRDEARARELVERSRAHLKSYVEDYHGRWLEEVGDGTLSVFPSAVEAVDCALAIQDSLRNEPEISLRIGIHLGDVVFAEGRVYGDGVNVASRIEGLAPTGGVAVSETVRSAIRGQSRVRTRNLGRKRLKNVDEPVRVFALIDTPHPGAAIQGALRGLWARRIPQVLIAYAMVGVILVLLARWLAARYGLPGQWVAAVAASLVTLTPAVVAMAFFRTDPGHARRAGDDERRWRPGRMTFAVNLTAMIAVVAIVVHDAPLPGQPAATIAVLPFDNLSGDEADEYFSDGLTDELISTLARIDALNVAARTSSFMFKGTRKDIEHIAEELQVRHVLDGSVRKAGNQVKISVQLVDAESGYNVWQETYEKTLDDIFAVQEDIARTVVSQLDVILPNQQSARLARAPTENIEAYDFYLHGLDYLHRPPMEHNLGLAENLFRNALMLDSEFALAYSGLCHVALQRYELSNAPRYIDQGESACQTAMDLDDSLNEVRVALGNLCLHTGRLDEAEARFRSAIAKAPRLAAAWVGLGQTLAEQEHDQTGEAEAMLRKATRLQPGNWHVHMALGKFLYWEHRFVEADKTFQRVISLTPDNARALHFLGSAYLVMGQLEKAIDTLQRSLDLSPSRQGFRDLGLAYYLLTDYESALRLMQRATEMGPDDHWSWGSRADVLRHLGRDEESDKAYRRAVTLAEDLLDRNPADSATRGVLGVYLARLGEYDAARESVNTAMDRAAGSAEVPFYGAEVELVAGSEEAALSFLERALENGFSEAYLARDPDFMELHTEKRFRELINAGDLE